jgi:hypothetical protein
MRVGFRGILTGRILASLLRSIKDDKYRVKREGVRGIKDSPEARPLWGADSWR